MTTDATKSAPINPIPGCKRQAKRGAVLTVAVVLGFYALGAIFSLTRSRRPADPDITAACSNAFATAAAISPFQDSVSDLDKAVSRCQSIKDWVAGNRAHRAIDGDPVEFLLNRCRPAGGAPLRGKACAEVSKLYPSFLYETPYAKLTPVAP